MKDNTSIAFGIGKVVYIKEYLNSPLNFNMHIIYRCPREPWAALGKTRVSNKCFEKCPFFGTFTTLKVLKEIIVLQRITSLDNHIRLITP